ncbi:hypothetical protein AK812_SmicGene14285 [Symbiodinium microadriaticum]|uniref:Uncharacterized protein n=1 Tax=Symbiodinium microadriaticum TaxID=2951 RepID=A0A1Q9E5Y5_SYMMI|nr:hypothetical protein AK812_SmicGene14285 [Symbiodinium microadriaticum]
MQKLLGYNSKHIQATVASLRSFFAELMQALPIVAVVLDFEKATSKDAQLSCSRLLDPSMATLMASFEQDSNQSALKQFVPQVSTLLSQIEVKIRENAMKLLAIEAESFVKFVNFLSQDVGTSEKGLLQEIVGEFQEEEDDKAMIDFSGFYKIYGAKLPADWSPMPTQSTAGVEISATSAGLCAAGALLPLAKRVVHLSLWVKKMATVTTSSVAFSKPAADQPDARYHGCLLHFLADKASEPGKLTHSLRNAFAAAQVTGQATAKAFVAGCAVRVVEMLGRVVDAAATDFADLKGELIRTHGKFQGIEQFKASLAAGKVDARLCDGLCSDNGMQPMFLFLTGGLPLMKEVQSFLMSVVAALGQGLGDLGEIALLPETCVRANNAIENFKVFLEAEGSDSDTVVVLASMQQTVADATVGQAFCRDLRLPVDFFGRCREQFSWLLVDLVQVLELTLSQGFRNVTLIEPLLHHVVEEALYTHPEQWAQLTANRTGLVHRDLGVQKTASFESLSASSQDLGVQKTASFESLSARGAWVQKLFAEPLLHCEDNSSFNRVVQVFDGREIFVKRLICLSAGTNGQDSSVELDGPKFARELLEALRHGNRLAFQLYFWSGPERHRMSLQVSQMAHVPSLWRAFKFLPVLEELANDIIRGFLGGAEVPFVVAHWKWRDMSAGGLLEYFDQKKVKEMAQESMPERMHMALQECIPEEFRCANLFVMTNLPSTSTPFQELRENSTAPSPEQIQRFLGSQSSEGSGLAAAHEPASTWRRLHGLLLDMAVGSKANYFLGYGGGRLGGHAASGSAVVQQMRLALGRGYWCNGWVHDFACIWGRRAAALGGDTSLGRLLEACGCLDWERRLVEELTTRRSTPTAETVDWSTGESVHPPIVGASCLKAPLGCFVAWPSSSSSTSRAKTRPFFDIMGASPGEGQKAALDPGIGDLWELGHGEALSLLQKAYPEWSEVGVMARSPGWLEFGFDEAKGTNEWTARQAFKGTRMVEQIIAFLGDANPSMVYGTPTSPTDKAIGDRDGRQGVSYEKEMGGFFTLSVSNATRFLAQPQDVRIKELLHDTSEKALKDLPLDTVKDKLRAAAQSFGVDGIDGVAEPRFCMAWDDDDRRLQEDHEEDEEDEEDEERDEHDMEIDEKHRQFLEDCDWADHMEERDYKGSEREKEEDEWEKDEDEREKDEDEREKDEDDDDEEEDDED